MNRDLQGIMIRLGGSVIAIIMLPLVACNGDIDRVAARDVESTVELGSLSRVSLAGDSLVARADSLVRTGHGWRATALLAARLRAPSTASPESRLAGARAAATWEGWSEVDRVLRGAEWLDAQFNGEGRELLARSELERGQDALADVRLALQHATSDADRAVRGVLLARAHDRANALDSATAGYSSVARRLPGVADWLRLRAAGALRDSGERAKLFAQVANPVARARVPFTDAQARERTGDFAGAARVYRRAGAEGSAFRIEALAARDSSSKTAVARRIIAYLRGNPATQEARQSLEVLDKLGALLTRDEELAAARAAAAFANPARAVTGLERVARAGALAPRDRYDLGNALLRVGRAGDAARELAAVAGDSALVAMASWQRARALLQAGSGSAARAALRAVATDHANVADAAAPALLLLADLQVDDGDLTGAAHSLAELTRRYPTAQQAPLARFRAGLLAWQTDARIAAAQFDTLAQRYPSSDEAIAAQYWAGRAEERLGRRAEAERRWRSIITTSPLSYYAGRSAQRLHVPAWTAPTGPDSAPRSAAVDSAIVRVALLERLGMDVEARFELDALVDRAEQSTGDAGAIGGALLSIGEASRALRVGTRALEHGTPTRALLLAAYPMLDRETLREESKRNGLDPSLVAGLIRQESSFNPRAVSPAGARGLMQIMPDVGATLASAKRYPTWNSALLFEPDVSLELGTAHLASSMRRDTPPVRALAAYNAGASRVTRWSQRPGTTDPELFAEWIPFVETRDYVRIVQRNGEIYRTLYGWKE